MSAQERLVDGNSKYVKGFHVEKVQFLEGLKRVSYPLSSEYEEELSSKLSKMRRGSLPITGGS